MSKVINVDFVDRVQRRFPVPPIGTPYQHSSRHNAADMWRRVKRSVANQSEAFRGGLGHRGPGGDAA